MGDHWPGLSQCDPHTMSGFHHARCARVVPSSATPPSGDRVPDVWVGGSYPASGDLSGLPGAPAEAGASKAPYPHTHWGVSTSHEVGAEDLTDWHKRFKIPADMNCITGEVFSPHREQTVHVPDVHQYISELIAAFGYPRVITPDEINYMADHTTETTEVLNKGIHDETTIANFKNALRLLTSQVAYEEYDEHAEAAYEAAEIMDAEVDPKPIDGFGGKTWFGGKAQNLTESDKTDDAIITAVRAVSPPVDEKIGRAHV